MLRPGRGDARALLIVWLLRRSFLPLLVVGAVVAAIVIGGDAPEPDLASPGDVIALLLSPWAGVAVAVGARLLANALALLLANALALLLALPLTGQARPSAYAGPTTTRWIRAAFDRLRLTRAYRELRWTWLVRELAARRLGAVGRRLHLADQTITITTVLAVGGIALALLLGPDL